MNWYPTPSYLLKRKVIIDELRKTSAKTFLEVGCGAGDLLQALDRLGYVGMGIEISQEAFNAALCRKLSSRVTVSMVEISKLEMQFDAVIASEVMEHWEDDLGFLKLLQARIVAGGWLFLTVPAHMEKWGKNDDFCGHVRRYGRNELHEKLVLAGFTSIRIFSYGVPLYNIMKPLYDLMIGDGGTHAVTDDDKTKSSGGMWLFTGFSFLFKLLFNDITMVPFYALQRLFFSSDMGNGYFISARKSS